MEISPWKPSGELREAVIEWDCGTAMPGLVFFLFWQGGAEGGGATNSKLAAEYFMVKLTFDCFKTVSVLKRIVNIIMTVRHMTTV